jgi:hypothetical protein
MPGLQQDVHPQADGTAEQGVYVGVEMDSQCAFRFFFLPSPLIAQFAARRESASDATADSAKAAREKRVAAFTAAIAENITQFLSYAASGQGDGMSTCSKP